MMKKKEVLRTGIVLDEENKPEETPRTPAGRWPKGVSGNPGGRPKKKPITERYEAQLEVELPESLRLKLKLKKGATYGDAVALQVIRQAILGKHEAAREVREAVEGRAPQQIHLSGENGGPVQVGPPLPPLDEPMMVAFIKAAEGLQAIEKAKQLPGPQAPATPAEIPPTPPAQA